MPENYVPELLRLAASDPAQALVRLWLLLDGHRSLEEGMDPLACEAEAVRVLGRLGDAEIFPVVRPAAAARAVDDYLAQLDLGNDPRVRTVRVEGPAGGEFYLIPRRRGWSSRFSSAQHGQREFWIRRHQVVPSEFREIEVTVGQGPQDRTWRKLVEDPVRFAAGGFVDEVEPVWHRQKPYGSDGLSDVDVRWRSVEAFLEKAHEHRARVVVLPELAIDAEVCKRLRSWLRRPRVGHRFAVVVAGSYHEEDAAHDGNGFPHRNVSRVYTGKGEALLTHVKLRPMRTGDPTAEGWIHEAVSGGHRLTCLFSELGLMAVGICLDFCETGASPVADLWKVVGPALMLVPSMGTSTTNSAHERRAKELALQHGTATIVASQAPKGSEACGLRCTPRGAWTDRAPVLLDEFRWDE